MALPKNLSPRCYYGGKKKIYIYIYICNSTPTCIYIYVYIYIYNNTLALIKTNTKRRGCAPLAEI